MKNKFSNGPVEDVTSHIFLNAWVRWGWFEDNVLSKFTSMTSDKNILIYHLGLWERW